MSNALAIATVSAGLAQIIQSAAQTTVPGARVVIGRPDSNASPAQRVHLYLYQVSPNSALRNNDLPTRSAEGKLVQRPRVALDLHYLLAFYGDENALEPQRMLGTVVRDLHVQPVLTKQNIADGISSYALSGSDLADSIEQIKVTPALLSLEEMSKIWYVFLQTPHALSVAYQASVVLIEPDDNVPAALPVIKRGREDRGVDSLVGPSPFPSLEEIHIIEPDPEFAAIRPRLRSYPSARLDMQLTFLGRNLTGDKVEVRFRHLRLKAPILRTPDQVSANELIVNLAKLSTAEQEQWPAGLYTVDVAVTNVIKDSTGKRDEVHTTNAMSLKLAPSILSKSLIAVPGPDGPDGSKTITATITIGCSPKTLADQPVTLLLANREVQATSQSTKAQKFFVIKDAPIIENAPLRLRVDGVDSMPFRYFKTDSNGKPISPPQLSVDSGQQVTIS